MRKLSRIYPGEILLDDFIEPLEPTQYRVAVDIGVAPLRISPIVHGKRAITADTALRLARYDLEVVQAKVDRASRNIGTEKWYLYVNCSRQFPA